MRIFNRNFVILAAFFATCVSSFAESREEIEKWLNGLQLQSGKTVIQGGAVSVDLPDEYRFIKADDAKKILSDVWNNPSDPSVIGMIVPKNFSPTSAGSWVVVLQDDPSGYVSDKDADSINYEEMMQNMKAEMPEINRRRQEKGFPTMDIIGWAERPYYDQASHKLYWAKEIKFGQSDVDTLNYNVRILGRRGVLQLNAIASMNQLDEVKKEMPRILQTVNYQEGSRYVDFDPHMDKVAGYGLAALVAGGIAAKVGLFKGLLLGILALKKFIVMGAVAVAAYFKRMLKWVRGLFAKKAS